MRKEKLKAVVLAAGLGTRLIPYTFFLPKPMLPLGEKPVLEHQIEWLKKAGISDILISTSYLGRLIENYFQGGEELGVKLTYSSSKRPLGTAGQLKSVENYVDGSFVCLYGDTLFNFDLAKVISFHQAKKALATLTLMPYETTLRYGFIDVDEEGRIKDWREKPKYRGLINIGCYVMEPSFIRYIPNGKVTSMNKAFEAALKAGELALGYVAKGGFIDIGDKASYRAAYDEYVRRLGNIL